MKLVCWLMKTLRRLVHFSVVAGWSIAVGWAGAAESEGAQKKSVKEYLEELKENARVAKPFTARYELKGPNGDMVAEMGRGEKNRCYVKLVSEDPGKTGLPSHWCDDDGRIFSMMGGQSLLMPDMLVYPEAASALRVALHGGEMDSFFVAPQLWLLSKELVLSVGSPLDVSEILKGDDTVKINDEDLPRLAISSEEMGEVLVDMETASILEQEINGRSMKRVEYVEEGAVERVQKELESFDAGKFEVASASSPDLRHAALSICQRAVNEVEAGRLSVEQMKQNMASGGERLIRTMHLGFSGGTKSLWEQRNIDDLVREHHEKARAEFGDKGYFDDEIDDEILKVDSRELAEKMAESYQSAIAETGKDLNKQAAKEVLNGELKAKTAEGKEAVRVIEEFLSEISLKETIIRIWDRCMQDELNKDLD